METLDYPETRDHYTPFLNMEVKIDQEGGLDTRLYRKPQKKLLTLNAKSHHPNSVKEHTITNMYQTAESVSSSATNSTHFEQMIDDLLLNNGYSSRVLEKIKKQRQERQRRRRKRLNTTEMVTTLKLPFLSDKCTAQVKRAAESFKIPVRIVTTPGRKLRGLLTSSRPLDKPQCPSDGCKTCTALGESGKCTDRNVVFSLKCDLMACREMDIGHYNEETYRPVGDRFIEHYANNPSAESYKEKLFAKRYSVHHLQHTGDPKVKLEIIARASNTMDRKIKEARSILAKKPDLNHRDEQVELRKFLV